MPPVPGRVWLAVGVHDGARVRGRLTARASVGIHDGASVAGGGCGRRDGHREEAPESLPHGPDDLVDPAASPRQRVAGGGDGRGCRGHQEGNQEDGSTESCASEHTETPFRRGLLATTPAWG